MKRRGNMSDFNFKEAGENTFWKIIEEHNQKYRGQIIKQWSEIARQAKENVEKKQGLKVFIGNVYEREIDYGNVLEFITVVSNKEESLSDVLDNFIGEKVKITIEVVSE
jgi:hypothetical protein